MNRTVQDLVRIAGWNISSEQGFGYGPDFAPMTFFCVVGPHVKTETRVDADGLALILPKDVYRQFLNANDQAQLLSEAE